MVCQSTRMFRIRLTQMSNVVDRGGLISSVKGTLSVSPLTVTPTANN